jgi:hypothetical protein
VIIRSQLEYAEDVTGGQGPVPGTWIGETQHLPA